jgi:hypothetical protein
VAQGEATTILLVKRQVSWGDANQHAKQAADDMKAKMRAAHL